MSELRRYPRITTSGMARIAWQDEQGELRAAHVSVVDMSRFGMQLKTPVSIPARTTVSIHDLKSPSMSGSASVRYCRRDQIDYVIGVEFSTVG